MTKAIAQNTAAAAQVEGASTLSPEMARLRLEYMKRVARNSAVFGVLEVTPKGHPSMEFKEAAHMAATGALRDVENQIHATPIRTLADALFVLRLDVKLTGTCVSLPTHRDPSEAALINALRIINALVSDDTSIAESPEDCDVWLSQAPYAEDDYVALVAAE